MNVSKPTPGRARILVGLLALYVLLTAWNLNIRPITGPDEPRYAAAARTMLRGGSLIIPEFNTRPRLAKPILFYWLIAGAAWMGARIGLDIATAMRLVPLIMGALVVLGTWRLGERLFGSRRGMLAAGIVMTTLEFQRLGRELVVDLTLAAFVLWAWVFFIAASDRIARSAPASISLLCFYLMLGLACLTKGPFMVGLFVVLPVVIYLLATRQAAQLRQAGLWWGAPLALALGGSWFVAVYLSGHDTLAFFIRENLQRMIGQADHQRYAPFIFYLEVIWENFAPWSLLIPFGVVMAIRSFRGGKPWPNEAKLLICALAVPFTLLGFAISKRSLYLLPLYPFAALALACTVERLLSQSHKGSLKATAGLIGAGALVCGAVEAYMAFDRSREPGIEAFYQQVRDKIGDRPVVMFGESSNEAVWYLDRATPVDRLSREELQPRFIDHKDGNGALLLVSAKVLAREPELKRSIAVLATLQRGRKQFVLAQPVSTGVGSAPAVTAETK